MLRSARRRRAVVPDLVGHRPGARRIVRLDHGLDDTDADAGEDPRARADHQIALPVIAVLEQRDASPHQHSGDTAVERVGRHDRHRRAVVLLDDDGWFVRADARRGGRCPRRLSRRRVHHHLGPGRGRWWRRRRLRLHGGRAGRRLHGRGGAGLRLDGGGLRQRGQRQQRGENGDAGPCGHWCLLAMRTAYSGVDRSAMRDGHHDSCRAAGQRAAGLLGVGPARRVPARPLELHAVAEPRRAARL
jgi:hypothetical protein